MKPANPRILTINGGSSSVKSALYSTGASLARRLYGKVDRIGLSGTSLTFNGQRGNRQGRQVHTRTPFAKVLGTTIIYPAEDSQSAQTESPIQHAGSQPAKRTRSHSG